MSPHRYSLTLFSGILLALVFYPFYFWPLAFVALVPLFFFAAGSQRSKKELFFGGFFTGVIGIAPTVYSSLFQMRLLPGDELFTYLVRASALPVLLLVACAFGLLGLCVGRLRSASPIFSALTGAALYGTLELFFMWLFGGYYLPSLSYAVVGFAPALTFASIGGAGLVSFLVAFINSMIAETLASLHDRNMLPYTSIMLMLACLCVVFVAGKIYSGVLPKSGASISASVIQSPYQNASELPMGTYQNGVFSNDQIASLLSNASAGSELVIYPFTPLSGATYDSASSSASNALARVPDAAIGKWLQSFLPASTTVLLWNSAIINGSLYDQYAVWLNDNKSQYEKRNLYALSDYAPAWASWWDLHGHTYTIEAGAGDDRAQVDGVTFGSLICSELHQQNFVKAEAARSPFLIAIGSDAMFPYDLMGNYSLAAARYRAAENGIPVLRGNMNGPSAFINADGSLQSSLGYFKPGVVRGDLPLEGRVPTLFSWWGNIIEYLLIAGILAAALFLKRKTIVRSYSERG